MNGDSNALIPEPGNAQDRNFLARLTAKVFRAQMMEEHHLHDLSLPGVAELSSKVDLQPVLRAMIEHAIPGKDAMIGRAVEESASITLAHEMDDPRAGGTGQAATHKIVEDEKNRLLKKQKRLDSLAKSLGSSSNANEEGHA